MAVAELRIQETRIRSTWRTAIRPTSVFGRFCPLTRLGDIATLTWQNIDLEHGEIRLITRKIRKTLILPIAAPLQRHIEAMSSSDDPSSPLHPGAFSIVSAQGKSGHLSNQFADLLAEAGLREKKKHRKNEAGKNGRGRGSSTGGLSFHCLINATRGFENLGTPEARKADSPVEGQPRRQRNFATSIPPRSCAGRTRSLSNRWTCRK